MKKWTITDPSGAEHMKTSKTRTYTHALVRRSNDSLHYIVNWSTNFEGAQRESRVRPAYFDHIEIVTLEEPVVTR